ncbi:30S ribosome-binding factor RbfA [bacterium]|nr:30S ribosome-binding factor RbfA [bacterium]
MRREISDPKIGFFTITYARISRDFKNATVGVSVIGSKEVQEETFEAIKHATGYIHHKLSKRSVMKYTPELKFEYDDMPDLRVEEILKNIEMEENEKN